jgi:hypothetical protein
MKGWGRPINIWDEKYSGYIYFIQLDRIGPIKIGFTNDVGNRLVSLQTSNPYPLRLLHFFPGNQEMEREIHSCFDEMRMNGEWFLPHPFILEEIQEQIIISNKRKER